MTITISKDNKQQEFTSLNKAAAFVSGTNTPRNAEACKRAILKGGFEIVSIDETTTTRAPKKKPIQYIIDAVSVVDKEAVKKLTKERLELMTKATSEKDFSKVIKLNEKIAKLQNPTTTLEDLLEYVKQEYQSLQETEEA